MLPGLPGAAASGGYGIDWNTAGYGIDWNIAGYGIDWNTATRRQ